MSANEILSVIEFCYAAALDPSLWPKALDEVARVVGTVGAVIVPTSKRRATETISGRNLEDANEAYRKVWWRHDTRVANSAKFGTRHAGQVITDDMLLTPQEKRTAPFLQEFCVDHRLGDFAAYTARNPLTNDLVTLSTFRELNHGAFSKDGLAVFESVAKHAARAFELTVTLQRAQDHLATLSRFLECADFGTILLNTDGRAIEANRISRRLINGHISIDRKGVLQATRPAQREKLTRLIQMATRLKLTGLPTMLVRGQDDKAPIFVELIPIARSESFGALANEDSLGAILIIRDVQSEAAYSLIPLLEDLGLTKGEARVAVQVGRGRSPAEAAMLLDLSESTVRSYLKAIFDKMGLSRQSQLAVLITRLDVIQPRQG